MTQEERDLLFLELSERLRYGVKVQTSLFENPTPIKGITEDECWVYSDEDNYEWVNIEEVKPYLRPLSNMTEEEERELKKIHHQFDKGNFVDAGVFSADDCGCTVFEMSNILRYLRSRNFDYCGMIDRGLALVASKDMYAHFGDMKTVIGEVTHKDRF